MGPTAVVHFLYAKLRRIGDKSPCYQVVVVDADVRRRRSKDSQVVRADRRSARLETLFVAAELTQTHNVEQMILDAQRDYVLDTS